MTKLNLGRTPALIIVDMQNGFCHADGHRGKIGLDYASAAAVVRPIARLLEAARGAQVPIFFMRYSLKADYSDAGLLLEMWPGLKDAGALIGGTWAAEIVPELCPSEGEYVIDKNRQSAFYGTDLEAQLRQLEVDTLIVCGVTTNMCVESTVRDGFCRDFRIFVPADGTAAPTEELHKRGLLNVEFGFGTVTVVSDLVDALPVTSRDESVSSGRLAAG
jgi:ureidoacrylate peracid hydrolase